MSTNKRIISLLLALVMVLGMLPWDTLGVGATGSGEVIHVVEEPVKLIQTEEPVANSDGIAVTRAQWLQMLVEVFDYHIEDEIVPDNYFTDLHEEAEYYEDILVAVYYGLVDVLPNSPMEPEAAATREFAVSTLNACMGYLPESEPNFNEAAEVTYPDDIQVALEQGWFTLAGGAFLPQQPITTEEFARLQSAAEAYVEEFTIIPTESQYTFKAGVIEITEEADISSVDGAEIITVENLSKAIASGDKFVVYSCGMAIPYRAETVSMDGVNTVITATALEFDEAIETMIVQQEMDTDPANYYAAEDAELIFIEEESSQEYSQQAVVEQMAKGSMKVYIPKFSKKVNIGDGISFTLSVELKNAKVNCDTNIGLTSGDIALWLDTDVEVSGKITCDFSKFTSDDFEIYIGGYEVPGVGGLEISLKMDAKGSISVVKKFHMESGIRVSYDVKKLKYRKNYIFKLVDKGSTVNAEISAKICIEAKFGLYGKALPLKGYVTGEAGFKMKLKRTSYFEITGVCTQFSAHLYAEVGAKVEWQMPFFEDKYSLSYSYDVIDEASSPVKISFHYEDGRQVGQCTRKELTGTTTGDSSAIGDSGYLTGSGSSYYGSGMSSGGSSQGYNDKGEPVVIYTYTLDSKDNATITGYKGNATSLSIPLMLDGYNVTAIGDNAFQNKNCLRTVIMQDNILTIGDSAFYGCTNLRNLTLSEGLTEIGGSAFANCTSLMTVDIPYSVTEIGGSAFRNCSSLQSVTLSKHLEILGDAAFYDCDALESIHIPKSLNRMSSNWYGGAFYNCDNLKTVTFEKGITMIAGLLFANCPGLESIVIPDTVTEIGESAFSGCTSLTTVDIPDSVTEIGANVFSNCTSLVTFNWPASLTILPNSAFYGCVNLNDITLPDTLTTIKANAFYNCDALTAIEIPVTVTSLGNSCFYDCDALETVDMANSVTSLGSSAFKHCDALKNVKLSRNLTSIPSEAFRECAELEQIVIPYFATKIEANAFNSSPKLKKVVVHEKLANINTSAFSYADRTVFYGPTSSYTETWCADNDFSFEENTVATTKVTSAESSITIPKGKTYMLDFDIDPIDFHEVITNKSSNTAVATVDETGKITAVAPGTATIKIIVGGASTSCKVTVTQGVTKITLNKTKLSLDVPQTYQLTATITPSDASNKTLNWTSSNPAAATVDANGLVTAVGNGTAVIKAESTDGTGISASCTVTVVDPSKIPVSGIALDKTSLSLEAMEDYQLTATVSPANAANKGLIWSSSNEEVATVDSNGKVTAVAKGTVTITAAAADGYGASASCIVTVTNNGYLVTDLAWFQSSHPYADRCTDFWIYRQSGAGSLSITFAAETEIEDGFDYLYIYDGEGNLIGKYTGTELANQTITIPGDTVKVQIESDDSGNAWGFQVVDVEYTDHNHSFTNYISDGNATCTEDGTKTAKCDHCDLTDTIPDVGSALGHAWGNWIVIQEPTTTENGVEEHTCTRCGHTEQRSIAKLENPFNDVAPGSFFYEPVMWAIENGITNGTSATTFGPNDQCMRAHVVTFLWRAVGSPEPTRTDNPFVDVKPTDFYYKPVLWAVENGITSGMDATHFGPTAYCNRAQVVTFLYRTMGNPDVGAATNPFTDVATGSFYEKPVLWAVENGVTAGLSATSFGPNSICNRAQIVTFLYRAFVD